MKVKVVSWLTSSGFEFYGANVIRQAPVETESSCARSNCVALL